MSSPATRARCLAGAPVGVAQASLTAVAHTAAGGNLPVGAPLAGLLIVSVAVGATAGAITMKRYDARIAALMAALCGGQMLGHLTLSVAGHHGGAIAPTTSMLAMHVMAAAILGLMIGLAEHVYVVCESVLMLASPFRRRPLHACGQAAPSRHHFRCGAVGSAAQRTGYAGSTAGHSYRRLTPFFTLRPASPLSVAAVCLIAEKPSHACPYRFWKNSS